MHFIHGPQTQVSRPWTPELRTKKTFRCAHREKKKTPDFTGGSQGPKSSVASHRLSLQSVPSSRLGKICSKFCVPNPALDDHYQLWLSQAAQKISYKKLQKAWVIEFNATIIICWTGKYCMPRHCQIILSYIWFQDAKIRMVLYFLCWNWTLNKLSKHFSDLIFVAFLTGAGVWLCIHEFVGVLIWWGGVY